jgi:PPE-repeat protein
MDFATLPPELNSGRMYTGPGSAPMLAAVQAWEAVAGELYSAANSYQSVISTLTAGPWMGPSSVTMAGAASSYVAWMSQTAALADATASQARAAAAAYETAFAATVPPEEVAANRSLLMTLVATNLLGQNTSAIAATEAQYSEMWAQDVGAMFGYAGSAASATQVTPFSSPQQTTNSEGFASQASVVGQAGETSAGSAQSTLSQISQALSSVPQALSSLVFGSSSSSASPINFLDLGADIIAFGIDAPMSPLGAVSMPFDVLGAQTGFHTDDIVSAWAALGGLPTVAMPIATGTASATSTTVYAGLGEAKAVGALSVPPTWTAATPAVRPVALALPATSIGAAQQALTFGTGSTLGDVAVASTAARGIADSLGTRHREPVKAAAAKRPAAAAEDAAAAGEDAESPSPTRPVVTGIASEIREFARLRDEGLISHEQFIEQRNRLLDISHPSTG